MTEKKKEPSLEELKKEYFKIQKKHNLPDFEKLNEDFSIEKLSDIETDYLLREIRKFMSEKMSHYLRIVETILNPTNVPMFVFSIVKSITPEEKAKLVDIYKKLSKMEIELLEIDVSFSAEKEAKFVKNSYDVWQEIKKDFLDVVGVVQKNWDNKFEVKNKGYFG
ncbi:hypothetical protein COU59_03635 [Candidatus Pacearchaeota archaeon CG10_big_fil_rev_8_21_14_0_10_34_12]|nr:MAG: hypothetical protein COU59_03635 [Candidatus Pacearchaeota archaeon CG10_big_fil_rev_8_21_14_0_10_34_12]